MLAISRSLIGEGCIIAVEGNKLLINFDKAASKRVMDSFVAKV